MNFTLVIISDDIVFTNLLVTLLKRELPDIQIVICSSNNDINEHFETTNCDLTLLDGGISAFSSIEILQNLRKVKLAVSPIWFFPEIVTSEYIHKSILMGASKIINKPFDPYLLITEIVSASQVKQLNTN